MNELQLKLAKRRQAMGDESVVESTTETKSTVPPSPSKLSLRTSMNDKPSPASSGIKSTSSSTSTPIKDSIKLFEKSKSSNLDKETTPTGSNTTDTNNNKSPQKPTPGKLKQFGLGLGINMNAFNPNAPRPSFAAKPSSSSSSTSYNTQTPNHSAIGEVISTADGDVKREALKPEMKHPTMKRPMVDKQMRRLSSVKKMDLEVLNHDDDISISMTCNDNYIVATSGSVDVDNDGSEGRKSSTASTYTPVLETISSADESTSFSTFMKTDATTTVNHITNNASITTTTAADAEVNKVANEVEVSSTTTKVNFDEKSIEEKPQKTNFAVMNEDEGAVSYHNNLVRLNSTLTSYDSFKTAHDSESVKQYNESDDEDDVDIKQLKRDNKRLIAEVESLKNELYQRDVKIISLEDEILTLKQRERMREEKSLLSTPTHKRAHYNNDNDDYNDGGNNVGSATPEHKRGVNRHDLNDSNGDDGSVDMYADSKHSSYTSSGINSGRLGTSRSDTSRSSNNNSNNNNNNNNSSVMATVSEEKLSSRRSSSATASKDIDDDSDNVSLVLNENIASGAAEYNNFGFSTHEEVSAYFCKPAVTSTAHVDNNSAAVSTMEKLQAHKLNIMTAMSFTVDDNDDDTAVDSINIEGSATAVEGNDSTVTPPATTSSSTQPVVETVSEAEYQAFITKLHLKDSAALMFFIKRFLSSVLGSSSASGSISGNVSRDNSRPSSPSKNNSNSINGNNNTDFSLSSLTSPTSPTAATTAEESINNSMRRSSSVFVGTTDLNTRYSDFVDNMMTHFGTHTFWRDHSNIDNNGAHNNVIDNDNSNDAASITITTEHKWNNFQTIQYCLEKYLMSHIYDVSWKYIKQSSSQQSDTDNDEDVVLLNQIQQLLFLTPGMLSIKPETLTRLQQGQQSIQSAIQSLIVLNDYKTPTDKAQCLVKCISTLYNLLYVKTTTDSQNGDETNKNDVNEFMSLFLYIIIQSKVTDLMTNQKWMSAFYHKSTSSTSGCHSTAAMKGSIDSTGYCLNQLKLVTDFLLKLPGTTNVEILLSQLSPYINLDSQEKKDEFKTMHSRQNTTLL